MNTAVPGTRSGLRRATSPRNRSSGSDPAWSAWLSSMRPFFQVLISVNTQIAITIGTQPPYSILIMFAEKNARSITRNIAVIGRMCASDQFHRARATTPNSTDVIAIVPVTAMPYAAPSDSDERKPMTSSRQPTINA